MTPTHHHHHHRPHQHHHHHPIEHALAHQASAVSNNAYPPRRLPREDRPLALLRPRRVCYHRCAATPAFKLVFWYAAQADALAEPVEGTREALGRSSTNQVRWVQARRGRRQESLTMAADGDVIEKMLSDMSGLGLRHLKREAGGTKRETLCPGSLELPTE
ncbi:hypothetical protein E4U41_005960 [Claviceps citrina]|nr:hypothetical protein E4U41_005960 [Claviceps citrina]